MAGELSPEQLLFNRWKKLAAEFGSRGGGGVFFFIKLLKIFVA